MTASIKPKGLKRQEALMATRNYIAVADRASVAIHAPGRGRYKLSPGSTHPADTVSEPRQVGERQPPGMDMEAAELGAAVQPWSSFFVHARPAQTLDEPIGISQPLRTVRHGAVPGPELSDGLARGVFQGKVPLECFAGFRLSPCQCEG